MSRAVLAWLAICGSLAAPLPVRADVCDSNPCQNGGICLSGLNDNFYSCECPAGFTDPNCSSLVEVASIEEDPTSAGPCLPNPCHNGGMCEISEAYRGDTFIGYVCKCPQGFNGIHCQHNVNECEAEPCRNGGICTDLVANYSCECPGEFMGRNCQQSKCSMVLKHYFLIILNRIIYFLQKKKNEHFSVLWKYFFTNKPQNSHLIPFKTE
ncbi:EGF-like repeat and discoidin I-like domain-containing protein 3 [Sylvia atricapilla]|uniref:EGF-like repeat and discoidin I-like domain-containing protein 3 n=1 Tax=Sylvia atricapilla TaxID=48155 RepID=UPI00339A9E8B